MCYNATMCYNAMMCYNATLLRCSGRCYDVLQCYDVPQCYDVQQCYIDTLLQCLTATMCYTAMLLRCAGRCYRPPLYACYRPTKDAHLSRVEEPPFFSIFSLLSFPSCSSSLLVLLLLSNAYLIYSFLSLIPFQFLIFLFAPLSPGLQRCHHAPS